MANGIHLWCECVHSNDKVRSRYAWFINTFSCVSAYCVSYSIYMKALFCIILAIKYVKVAFFPQCITLLFISRHVQIPLQWNLILCLTFLKSLRVCYKYREPEKLSQIHRMRTNHRVCGGLALILIVLKLRPWGKPGNW